MVNQIVDVKSSNEINGEIHLDNVAPMTIIRLEIYVKQMEKHNLLWKQLLLWSVRYIGGRYR